MTRHPSPKTCHPSYNIVRKLGSTSHYAAEKRIAALEKDVAEIRLRLPA